MKPNVHYIEIDGEPLCERRADLLGKFACSYSSKRKGLIALQELRKLINRPMRLVKGSCPAYTERRVVAQRIPSEAANGGTHGSESQTEKCNPTKGGEQGG